MRIKYFNDFPEGIKLLSSQIQINMLFKANDEIKIRRCDKSIHKDVRIPVGIHQTNKMFSVIVQQQKYVNWNVLDHLWLTFLDHHSMTL